jgi:hypothetical protein
MASRFAHDFSRVRIHADRESAEIAASLNARAFTVGQHVFFGADEFAPQTLGGSELLAHELSHVIEQEGQPPVVQRQAKTSEGSQPALTITGVIAAGGDLSTATIEAVNEAAKNVPARWKRFVAYAAEIKVGGSLAWRANNPGNLRYAPTQIASAPGATGTFSVFTTMEEGRAAQKQLYLKTYGTSTVRDAVGKHLTPPNENDTPTYLKQLQAAGVNLDSTMKSQIDVLMTAIEASEGVIEGVLVPRPEIKREKSHQLPLMILPPLIQHPDKARVAPSSKLLGLPWNRE